MRLRILIMANTLLVLIACVASNPTPDSTPTPYENEISEWHETRNARLNQPDGWLTLTGLFWLEQGENSFGAASTNNLTFTGNDVPPMMGYLVLTGDSVSFQSIAGIQVAVNDIVVERVGLKSEATGNPDMLSWGSLTWYIIERGDRIGVRLKDSAHPNYVNFKPTELFPINEKWRVPATLVPSDSTTMVEIINVLGDASPNPSPGKLYFEIDGQMHTLSPLGEAGDANYFIIFGDASNGRSTYGAGRFLVIPAVDKNNQTIIDFNKAYNMPCVFSPYATCPLPPEENLLSVSIEAGERSYEPFLGH